MKKYVMFSILSVLCLSVTSCNWMQNKEQPKKKQEKQQQPQKKPSHRRYHSNLNI